AVLQPAPGSQQSGHGAGDAARHADLRRRDRTTAASATRAYGRLVRQRHHVAIRRGGFDVARAHAPAPPGLRPRRPPAPTPFWFGSGPTSRSGGAVSTSPVPTPASPRGSAGAAMVGRSGTMSIVVHQRGAPVTNYASR